MGQCCSNQYHIMGEEFVSRLLQDPSLKLKDYEYNRLLNDIVSKRIQQEIHKKHVKDLLIPEFYDAKSKLAPYYQSIFDYALTQLKDKNNMYTVILLFYPFISHSQEKTDETMYGIFTYMNVRLTVKAFEQSLIDYITFCTKGLTYAIWQKCDDPNIAAALDDLNTNVYNEGNTKRFVEKMMFDIKKTKSEEAQVEKEDFKKLILKWDISSAENIRAMMTSEY